MGHKGVTTTHNASSTFGLVANNKLTEQWRSKRFQKGKQSFKVEKNRGRPPDIDNDQLKAVVFLKLDEKVLKSST